jgi:hypothetical protein
MTVLDYIKDLENKNMIYEKKERPNSQSFMMYISKENKLVSVLGELEEFKEAYANLLKKSKEERIDKKDYSEVAKSFSLEETDPAKWREEDRVRYLLDEIEKYAKNVKADLRFVEWRNRSKDLKKVADRVEDTYQRLLEMDNELRSKPDSKRKNETMLKYHKLLSDIEADIVEPKPLLDNIIHSLYSVKDHEVLFLFHHAVFLYYWFVEIMVFRIAFVWPNSGNGEQTSLDIYPTVFRILNEIQVQLSDFFRTNKIGFLYETPIENVAFFVKQIRDLNLKPYYLPQYQVLGMKSEIRSVTNSLIRLNEEIKNYNFIDMSDIVNLRYDIDELVEVERAVNELLKWIRESKDTTKIEIGNSEYQYRNQMIIQLVDKIVQVTHP